MSRPPTSRHPSPAASPLDRPTTMRALVTTAVSVGLGLSAVAAPAAAAPSPEPRPISTACPADLTSGAGFTDVSGAVAEAVTCVWHWQVANGETTYRYSPAETVTRGQMAAFIARYVTESGGTLPDRPADAFPDDGMSAFHTDINRLAAAGIVRGEASGHYRPDHPVTRAQMASYLLRAAEYRAGQDGGVRLSAHADYFPDDAGSPHEPAVNAVASAGVAAGYTDGSYRPDAAVRRDHMAVFLARLLALTVEEGLADLPDGRPTPPPAPDPAPEQVAPMGSSPFAQADWLTEPVPASPRLDPRSAAIAGHLADGKHVANVHQYGVPIHRPAPGTPRRSVRLTEDWGPNVFTTNPTPLTAEHTTSAGSDAAMVVLDPQTGTSHEFWRYSWNGGNPTASWGTVMDLDGDGTGPNAPTGAGISRLAGVVTTEEFTAGRIDHALVFSTDNACAGDYRYPAAKTDGAKTTTDCIPEGARIQLDPDVDISTLPAKDRAVAAALQTYGAYAIDNGGTTVAFIFQTPTDGTDPYTAAGWTDYHNITLPWDHLRVLATWNGS